MSSSPSDAESPTESPRPGPVMFQAPPRGPGRPSGTSTSTTPPPSTSETSPSRPEEPSTPQAQDWSTRPHPGDAASVARPDTSSGSPGIKGDPDVADDIRKALVNATEAAHGALTDDVGRAFGQFRATEDELDEVSDAAAGLLGRRVPKGVGNPDVADLIRAGIALIAYGVRQINIMRVARAARRKMASATEGQNGGETS